MNEFDLYKQCIVEGVDLQYGKLSLCDLQNYKWNELRDLKKRYQVHSDDPKCLWSAVYDNVDAAVTKFCEIKKRVRKTK